MAKIIVDMIFHSMAEELARGNEVEIRGVGILSVRHYRGRVGKNPKTGKAVEVKSKRTPYFRVGKELRTRVNSR